MFTWLTEDPLRTAFGFTVAGAVVLAAAMVALAIETVHERREAAYYDRIREGR